ncbi:MAG: DUF11 domain-containing protein [Acidimicrobiales bacterium]|nr:DUF11 domain-containing protein [Acidimicrobiales bacterium]
MTILSDSTSPDDPDDGEIQTLDIATYRLNLSQNGADSTSDVVATVSLVNALFSDADPIAPGINPPSVCNSGSSISSDRRTLVCNVGRLRQGTAVALDYSAMASGDVANGDQLTGTVRVGALAPVALPALTITGSNRVDVSKHHVSTVAGRTASGIDGHFVRYRLDVRTASDQGRGGLPLDRVSFTDDWSDLAARFPGTRLVTGDDPTNPHGQIVPVGLNRTSPVRSEASVDPAATQNSTDWIIPEPGSWSFSATSSTDTTVEIVASGFSNMVIANRSTASTVVTSGLLTLFIPGDSVPVGTTNFTNTVTNVAGTPRGSSSAVGDYNPSNNSAQASLFKVLDAGYRNQSSAWVNSDFGISGVDKSAIVGNHSNYRRPAIIPANWSSGGHQKAYRTQAITAEAVSSNTPTRISVGRGVVATMTCIKFAQNVTSGGDAHADVVGLRLLNAPEVAQLPHGPITIQYGTIIGNDASRNCGNNMAAWTTTRPSTFNAVRAFADVSGAVGQASSEGRNISLVLQVPVEVPASATTGQVRGFWNTSVNGSIDGATFTPSSLPVDGDWIGTSGAEIYHPDDNSGDSRSGDRFVVADAVSTFDKRVCETDGETREVASGDSVEFCLSATLEGAGLVSGIEITDEDLAKPGSPFDMVPLTSRVSINGATASFIEESVSGSNTIWELDPLAAPATVEIRFRARSKPGVAVPGSSWTNTARIQAPGLPDFSHLSAELDPNSDQQTVRFRSGRFQLNVSKSTISPSTTYPNTGVFWDLRLTNQGESPIGAVDMIDVLPFNGDGALGRVPPSSFHGSTGLLGAVSGPGSESIQYSTAAPGLLSSNPQAPSNQPGGSANWQPNLPADPSTVTAIRVIDNRQLLSGESRLVQIPMAASGNRAGDIYTNDVGAVVLEGSDGPILPIVSNDVSVEVQAPGLSILKETQLDEEGNPQVLYPGVRNAYRLTYSNSGLLPAHGVMVRDYLRPGLTPEVGSISNGGTYDPDTRTITWDLGTVEALSEGTMTFSVRVESPVHPDLVDVNSLVPNSAYITGINDCVPLGGPPSAFEIGVQTSAEGIGEGLDERCGSTVTNPVGNPKLVQDKVVDLSEALPGNELTYTIRVSNAGSAPATTVIATDEMPEGVTRKSVSSTKGEIAEGGDNTLSWDIGELGPAETVVASVVVTIDDGQWDKELLNKVLVTNNPEDCTTSDCPAPEVEHPCSDDAAWSCAVTQTPLPSLRQDKVVDLSNARPGEIVTYTLSIINEGSATAKALGPAVDHLPEGLSVVDISNDGVWDAEDRTITWTELADMEPGERKDLTVSVRIDSDKWDYRFVNRFEVDAPEGWPETNVDHPCEDQSEMSCALTLTPQEPSEDPQPKTPSSAPAPEPVDPPQGPLPRTGFPLEAALSVALIFGAGGFGVMWARRRSNHT